MPLQIRSQPPPVATKPTVTSPNKPSVVAMSTARAQAEIDNSRPGGVTTLKRTFEHKTKPVVTDGHFRAAPSVAKQPVVDVAPREKRQSAVTFSKEVCVTFLHFFIV